MQFILLSRAKVLKNLLSGVINVILNIFYLGMFLELYGEQFDIE
jgi:hypothetical protein